MKRVSIFVLLFLLCVSCKVKHNDSENLDTIDFGDYVYSGHIDHSIDRKEYVFNSETFNKLVNSKQYFEACRYARQYTFKDSEKQKEAEEHISSLEKIADYLASHHNDSIQGVFFESHFGDTKEKVIDNLNKYGFIVDKRYSTDCTVHLNNRNSRFFNFGNINWEFLIVEFINNRFSCIQFIISNRNRTESIKDYEYIVKQCKQKYNIVQDDITYETEIACASGITPNNRSVTIICESYYPFDSQTIMYRTALVYRDKSFPVPNNEL